jgi:hypothetical protein
MVHAASAKQKHISPGWDWIKDTPVSNVLMIEITVTGATII